MRVRYSFSSRMTRRIEGNNKHRKKFTELAEDVVNQADVILEVLDARFINETRNPEIEEMIKKQNKKLIYVLNKSDFIDERKMKKQLDIFPYVFVSCKLRRGSKELRERIKIEVKKLKLDSKADLDKKAKVGVIGYPNTGKSSLINLLIGKSSAKTAVEAGFTKGIQKINLTNNIVLLDSPGVIPRSENSAVNKQDLKKHVEIGVRNYFKVKDPDMLVQSLMTKYPGVFETFYGIDAQGNSEVLIEELGRKRGFLRKGNEVDVDRTARIIIKDWQEARIKV